MRTFQAFQLALIANSCGFVNARQIILQLAKLLGQALRFFSFFLLYLVLVAIFYLIVLWDLWPSIWSVLSFILLFLLGLVVFLLVLAMAGVLFERPFELPFIQMPRNEFEAALLLQKVLNLSEYPEAANDSDRSYINSVWLDFIFYNIRETATDGWAKALVAQVVDIEAQYSSDEDIYYDACEPQYAEEPIRRELYALVANWAEQAQDRGYQHFEYADYLSTYKIIKPSLIDRVFRRVMKRE